MIHNHGELILYLFKNIVLSRANMLVFHRRRHTLVLLVPPSFSLSLLPFLLSLPLFSPSLPPSLPLPPPSLPPSGDLLIASIARQFTSHREEHDRLARLWTQRYAQ